MIVHFKYNLLSDVVGTDVKLKLNKELQIYFYKVYIKKVNKRKKTLIKTTTFGFTNQKYLEAVI